MPNCFFLRSTESTRIFNINVKSLGFSLLECFFMCYFKRHLFSFFLFKQNVSHSCQVFLQSISPHNAVQNTFTEGTVTVSRRLLIHFFRALILRNIVPSVDKAFLSGSVTETADPLISCNTLLGMASETTEYSFGVIGTLNL